MTTVYVPKEPAEGETRIAATPATVRKLVAAGLQVVVEAGAGAGAFIDDAAFAEAGATLQGDGAAGLAAADLVVQVSIPTEAQVDGMKEGASVVSYLWPYDRLDLVQRMNGRRLSAFAMDALPRITRAQKHDALSSQGNLAGYKAAVMVAERLPRIFPMLMTAAGTIRPSKVVVIGAGVAGLQAIATARRLGAVVEVSDVRPEVKEEAESLGATFIEVEGGAASGEGGYAKEQTAEQKQRQKEVLEKHLVAADAIICTALIPYRPAPVIVTESVVQKMRAGSVIVDLAAERGGNCECTVAGEVVVAHGVTVMGVLNLPATLSVHASDMYANNIRNLVLDYVTEGEFTWDLADEIVAGALICHDGQVLHPKVREAMGLPALQEEVAS
ncbi:MAG: Re/Si-specific NAD(P)(+) transhydrogenase subunit alpha [Deltaproteobacteria bacterium]|nr:Re/Si-specific NAD(P)(+) transhydrogenase subunit alpha [Deltaproteobacteria bacterium]MBW2255376.1 Re/Si-specific NAD(P)(+) transhydrogenase subunit alpha [Deltaproteobacteria bacterium]